MSCTQQRIDTANLNDNSSLNKQVAETVVDTARTKVGFAWSEAKTLSATHNRICQFVEYDYVAGTLGTEVNIDDTSGGSANDLEAISLARLDSGVLVCAYGLFGVQAKESSDHGATWSASRSAVDGTSGVSTRAMVTLGTDGTDVWCISQERAGGAGGRNLYATKRTGVDTWDTAGRKTLHAAGGVSTPPYFLPDGSAQTAPRMLLIKSGTSSGTQCFVANFVDTGPTYYVSCLWTTDAWVTINQTNIKLFPNSYDRQPKLRLGTDGRIRCAWVDDLNAGTPVVQIAYSDDFGQTWTVVGTPSPMGTGQGWGTGGNRGFALGSSNAWFISTMDSEGESAPYPHRQFVGGDGLTGWTEADCPLSFTSWLNNAGEAFISGTQFWRVFGGISGAGPYKNVSIILGPTADSGGGGGSPPTLEESPTGLDEPNVYLRLDIADNKGWSAHDLQVACMFPWPEGDYTSERRKHELVAAAASVDPTVQNPAYLAAIYKIDDEERWSKEAFVDTGSGVLSMVEDPFNFRWYSAQMNIGETGSTNLVRAIYLRYRREGLDSFDVQVYLDGELIDTQTIGAAWPEPEEKWWPIPRAINDGSRVQLRISDTASADLIIESFAVKFRPKHWRMRNV